MPTSTATVTVAYDGDALDEGVMDVRDLAPALLAMGELFREANWLINGTNTDASVNVHADVKRGSFAVDLQVIQNFGDSFVNLFSGTKVTAAVNLATIVLLGKDSVVWLGKQLKGRKVRRAVTLENGRVRLELPDGEFIAVPAEVARVYNDVRARAALRGSLKPLERDGIDVFQVRKDKEIVHEIHKHEIGYFAPLGERELVLSGERQAALEVLKTAFDERYKWMFWDGSASIQADIADEEFLTKVAKGELSFKKGMVLSVTMRDETWRDEEGIHTLHTVLQVDHVIPPPRQIPLEDDEPTLLA